VHNLAQQLLFLRIEVTVDVGRRHRAEPLSHVERLDARSARAANGEQASGAPASNGFRVSLVLFARHRAGK
jgi:hypothetical protein